MVEEEAWGLISFEFGPSDEPHCLPPVVQDAFDVYHDLHQPADFCVLVNWRHEGDKIIRDYCFSPETIRHCGTLFVSPEIDMRFRARPHNEPFTTAIGCEKFARQVAMRR